MVQQRGIAQLIADMHNREMFIAQTLPASYGAGAQNVLAITGGMVLIHGIFEYLDTALGGATTTRVAVGAVACDVGAVAIDAGGQFAIVVSPLDAAVAKIASALAVQAPSLLGFATNQGVIAGPGVNIVWTFAGAAMGGAERVSLHVLYEKVHREGLIA